MILRSIKLQNFRKFKYSEIDFPDGVIGIFGLNGVGKSTIFEALAWAFYGHVAARTSSDKIKREGATPSDRCKVEVEFVFNENNIRVTREMVGKSLSPSASVVMNGKVVANGAEATTRFIQNLFGMDAKTFFTSIFAKQKELNALSTMNPSERKQLIVRMLGIDALDRAIKDIRSDLRNTKELIEHYNISLRDAVTGKPKKDVCREQIVEREKRIEEINRIIDERVKELSQAERECKIAEKEKEDAERKYEEIQKKLDELRKRKEAFERRKRLEEEIKKLEQSIRIRETELQKKEEEVRRYEGVKENLDKVEGEIDDLKQKIKDVIAKIQREKAGMENLEREKRKIESKKQRIASLGPDAVCPTCERVLGDHYQRLIEKFDREISESDNEREKIKQSMERYLKERERLERLEEALLRKRKYLLNIKMSEEKVNATIQSILRELDRERKEKSEKERELHLLGIVTFDEKLYKEIEGKVKELYSKYKKKVSEYGEKQKSLHAAKERLREIENERKLLEQQIEELKSRIKEYEEMERRIEEEKENLHNLTVLEELMTSFRTEMISRIRPTLSAYASSLLENLTDGKYSEMELNESYDIVIYDGGNPYEINRFSGGEEDLANLCIRLAISEMLTERAFGEFNLIILDEVFGSQDVNRRRNILNALNTLSNRFRQIFIITHIEDVKQLVGNAILVYEDTNGISKIKVE